MKAAADFFSAEEQARITAAINGVEEKTAGEVAVMVVDASDTYPEGRILAGLLLGGLAALVATDLLAGASLWLFIPIATLLALLLGWLTGPLPALRRLFIPAARLEQQVRDRALRAFYEKGLYKTRDATGVLFFVSLFEHRVWVLADEGIYRKIAPEELERYARDVARGVREGRAAAALCRGIEEVGAILARHFPVRADDVNELTDEIILE